MVIDPRDLKALRERMLALEEDQRRLRLEFALLMEGIKERLDDYGVLLARAQADLADPTKGQS